VISCPNKSTDQINASGYAQFAFWVISGYLLNTLENKMKIDPQYIINSCQNYALQHYRDGNDADRLSYQIGMLNAKIIELCNYIENAQDEIKQLQMDIIQLKGEK
jgi:peptidoglycan hydrolase CwlO-like protein